MKTSGCPLDPRSPELVGIQAHPCVSFCSESRSVQSPLTPAPRVMLDLSCIDSVNKRLRRALKETSCQASCEVLNLKTKAPFCLISAARIMNHLSYLRV